MTFAQDFRNEFRLQKAAFAGCEPSRMNTCKIWNVQIPLMLFRCAAFLFTTSVLAVVLVGQVTSFGYAAMSAYTIWSYFILACYFFTAFCISAYLFCKKWVRGNGHRAVREQDGRLGSPNVYENSLTDIPTRETTGGTAPTYTLPWYMRIQWCLYNIALPSAVLVTIIYWSVLYPMLRSSRGFQTSFLDVSLHGLNSLLIITEQYISAIPTRLLHVWMPMVYASIYLIFYSVFWSYTGVVLYPYILDWTHPGITTGSLFAILLYYAVAQLVLFVIFRLQQVNCRTVHDDW